MEVCARDGLQAVKGILPTDKKIELVLRLVRNAGVKILDVASFVNPKLVPQLDDGAAVLKVLQSELVGANVQLTCLAPNARGMESALKAGATSVSVWVHGSNAFSHKNLGMSCEEHMQQNRVIAGMAEVEHGVSLRAYVSGAIHCPLEGVRIDPQAVGQLAESLAHLSPKVEEIVLADTTGRGGILQVKEAVMAVQSQVNLPLGLHLHNTFGYALGVASSALAEDWNVSSFEGSAAGLGGCPFAGPNSAGNVASEDLAYMFEELGCNVMGVKWQGLLDTGRWLCNELSVEPQSFLARVSRN